MESVVTAPGSERFKLLFGRYTRPGCAALNLGCALNHEPGMVNLDVSPKVGADVVFNLEKCASGVPLPFPDNHFDLVLGSHVFEHIVHLVPLVREVNRILKPGGHLISITPHGASDDSWENPFHVRGFTERTWCYFDKHLYEQAGAGHGDFGIDYVLHLVHCALVPFPEFGELPADVLARRSRFERNIIMELHAVLEKA